MTDIGLRILLQAQDQASSVIKSFMGLMGDMNGRLGLLAGAGILAVGAGLAYSTKRAADFEQSMLSLVAHAGLAKSQFDNVSQAVMAMSADVGRSPIELADALYPILSAFSGITNQSAKTAISLDTLKMAFETVAGTTVDGTAVANAAVSTFNALGLATNDAGTNTARMTALFDVMDKTVQLANTNWDQYKNVVAKVATSAKTAGVSFTESQAALATLTSQGLSAQKAGTYLVNTFNTLEIKTDSLAKHAKKLHISFDESKYASMNLADKIKYLNEITGGNSQKLLALMGNNSTALQTFKKLSTGVQTYKNDLDALNHSQGALKTSFDTASQGTNFKWQQLKAALDALAITIGSKLLPAASHIASAITPAIVAFTNWIAKSENLKAVMPFVLGALAALAFIVMVTVVPAFLAWAAATIAATWPILLIAAIVGIAVTLIILAIQHWGQIAHWLQGVWQAVLNWLKSAWGNIVGFFQGIWHGIQGAFANVGGWFHDRFTDAKNKVQSAWGNVGNFFSTSWKNIKQAANIGVQGVIDSLKWLYNHNYYFKAFVDKMREWNKAGMDAINAAWKWLQTAWANTAKWLGDRWNELKGTAQKAWDGVKSVFEAVWGWMSGIFHSIWSNISSWFNHTSDGMHSGTTSAWQQVSSVFSSAWGTYVAGPLNSLAGSIGGFFSNLAGTAATWGQNLIQGFINGIGSMLGAVGNAAQNVMSKVAGILGFHSPAKEGPGRDADKWAPALMKMYAQGIEGGRPTVQNASLHVANTLQQNMTSSRSGRSESRPTVIMNITINGPSRQMADQFIDEVSRRLRQSGNLITWTSGGRA